jgi:hypothetical protein
VLEYNVEASAWKEIGKLATRRSGHAIAEIGCIGNLNPVKIGKKITNISRDLLCPKSAIGIPDICPFWYATILFGL